MENFRERIGLHKHLRKSEIRGTASMWNDDLVSAAVQRLLAALEVLVEPRLLPCHLGEAVLIGIQGVARSGIGHQFRGGVQVASGDSVESPAVDWGDACVCTGSVQEERCFERRALNLA